MSAVRKAIDNYGTRYKFAKDMNVRWIVVNRWYKNGAVPVEHCTAAAKLLGVTAATLNPAVAKVFS